MQRISEHLEEVREPVRVLERIAELTLKKPPPLVPELLDVSCEATGPRARSGDRAAERLQDALRDEQQRADDRDRQQHVERSRATRSCQKLPSVGVALRRADDAADQRDGDDDADRRRDEVLHGQPGHLAEVRHRRLAAVVLPVRVGHERRGGVERHVPRAGVEALRVERVQRLRAQDQVEQRASPRARRGSRCGRRPSSPGRARGRRAAAGR